MRTTDFDAAVVGCGPAGASAAHALASAGARVVLIDREALPRYKVCGGGVVRRALRFLPRGFELPVQDTCRAVELRIAGLPPLRVERPAPIVSMTMRAELDLALTEAAQRAGAELRAPCEVAGVAQDEHAVTLDTSLGSLRARALIGADGALSSVARLAGFPGALTAVPALEAECALDPSTARGVARFDLGVPANGYGWVFPKRAGLSCGVLSMRARAPGLRAELAPYLSFAGVDGRSVAVHGHVIPLRPRASVVRGRVLLCGDAAGLADPVTGEGISWALESGRIAAEALIEAAFEPATARAAYERRLASDVLPELAIARALASLLYRRRRVARALLARAGPRLCEAMADVVYGERTYRELFSTPARRAALHVARALS